MLEPTYHGIDINVSKSTTICDFDVCDMDDMSLENRKAKDFLHNVTGRKLEQNLKA